MIVFDQQLLENTFLLDEAQKLNDQHFISKAELQQIKKELPVLKSNTNILLRIGFFILGTLLYSSLIGVIALFSVNAFDSHLSVIMFIYAALGIFGSEFLAKQQYLFGYGLDDAFILGFQGFFCAALGVAFESPMMAFIALAFIGFAP